MIDWFDFTTTLLIFGCTIAIGNAVLTWIEGRK